MSKPVPSSAFNLTPSQSFMAPGLSLLYLAPLPIISRLCAKGGIVERTLLPTVLGTFKAVGLGEVTKGRIPTALLLATFVSTYILSATISIAGQASHSDGYVNKSPRERRRTLTGYALRLTSANDNLLENYPAVLSAAVLAQVLAPNSFNNELALLYFLKGILYPVSYYVESLDVVRSFAHIASISTAMRILYKIAFA